MIGAATPPVPGAAPGALNPGQAEPAPAREACTDAARGSDAAANGTAKPHPSPHGAVDGAARREDADGGTRDGAPPRDFADLLAAGTVGEGDAAAAPTDTARERTPATPVESPDQLLALLAGALAVPPTPSTPAAAAAPAELPSRSARPAAPLPPALASAANAASAASAGGTPTPAPAPADAAAAGAIAGNDAFAALAKLAGEATAPAADASAPATAGDAAQAASLASIAATASTAANARPAVAPGAPLALPANPEAGFDDGFGTRVAWIAEQRLGHAEIRLNPEHLGPIDVRVQLDGTRVAAEFHSAHAEVRQAIEASVPRLREMLGQHGLQLGHADVGQRHAQGRAPRRDDARGDGVDADAGTTRPVANAPRLRSRGLLDEYA